MDRLDPILRREKIDPNTIHRTTLPAYGSAEIDVPSHELDVRAIESLRCMAFDTLPRCIQSGQSTDSRRLPDMLDRSR